MQRNKSGITLAELEAIEPYLQVMTRYEQKMLIQGQPLPSGATARWRQELREKQQCLSKVFARAYNKQKEYGDER